ncbi:hypothetical protein WOLCODRAFT_158529 [Wolfiporia cocos MD-104 SS10]|uniref:Uncharacterized protein n=1 Tax=Wolfiporia cocos (strain MD-104) TaxID=742152 RepID=A0A2H3JMP5_WOLCO|nr:hypothetical protein WOLCODRAFT_158529 [Wolfiporia cocos MD-104 SS10]
MTSACARLLAGPTLHLYLLDCGEGLTCTLTSVAAGIRRLDFPAGAVPTYVRSYCVIVEVTEVTDAKVAEVTEVTEVADVEVMEVVEVADVEVVEVAEVAEVVEVMEVADARL